MADDVGSVFSALADPTRRQVLRCLASGGPISATRIAAQLPVSRQAVAKHLAALGEAGLVKSRREGRETLYLLTPQPFSDAMLWMSSVGSQWDDRLAALSRHLVARASRRTGQA